MDEEDVRRFFGFVQRANGCWLWQGRIDPRQGYGTFWLDGKAHQAHRVSYLIHVSRIPDGMVVRQTCGNMACVHPDHLEVIKKYTWLHARGRATGRAKLSEADVIEIRKKREKRATLDALARQYRVDPMTIHDIVTGKTWKHVK